MGRVLTAGLLYFALVFGAGFALGTVRVLWAVPRLGVRAAELGEAPLMLVATLAAAWWVIRRLAVPPAVGGRLGMGAVAVLLLLVAELGLVLPLRGLSLAEYWVTRDPVAAAVYYALLGVLAVAPALVARR